MTKVNYLWNINFDLTSQKMYVYMGVGRLDESIEARDKKSTVDIQINDDNIPYVIGVEIDDPNKFTILQDWIEEAIEKALEPLNANYYDDFGNNHWKGNDVSTS